MKHEFTYMLEQMKRWREHTPSKEVIAADIQTWIDNIQRDLNQFRENLDYEAATDFCNNLARHAKSITLSREELVCHVLLHEYEHVKSVLAKYGEIEGLYRINNTVLAIYKGDARNPSAHPVAASIYINQQLGLNYKEALSHLEIITTVNQLYKEFADPDNGYQNWKYLCYRHPELNVFPIKTPEGDGENDRIS